MRIKKAISLFLLAMSTVSAFGIDVFSSKDSFMFECGTGMNYTFDQSSGEFNTNPDFTFYFGRVERNGAPSEEAAFLNQVGWADIQAQFFTNLKQTSIDDTVNSLDNTTVGFDLDLRWVYDGFPLIVEIPLEDKRIRWKTDETTVAVLRYHILALRAGYYIFPETEISLGWGYLQPDLFYKTDWDSTIYSYLAADVGIITARMKSVMDLSNGMWLSTTPEIAVLYDDNGNLLYNYAAELAFYPVDSLRIGLNASSSDFVEGDSSVNPFIEVLGASSLAASVKTDLFDIFSLEVMGSVKIAADPDYDPVFEAGGVISARY